MQGAEPSCREPRGADSDLARSQRVSQLGRVHAARWRLVSDPPTARAAGEILSPGLAQGLSLCWCLRWCQATVDLMQIQRDTAEQEAYLIFGTSHRAARTRI